MFGDGGEQVKTALDHDGPALFGDVVTSSMVQIAGTDTAHTD